MYHACHLARNDADTIPFAQNVLVAEKDPVHVKLADFGISKQTEGTELKTQVGTFGYMAPEVL